jgi:HK97 family phage major capsid protein
MNYTLKEHRAIENAALRAAKNQILEKGSSPWTPAERAEQDSYINRAELAQDEISKAEVQRHATELYIRKPLQAMSAPERRMVQATMSTTTTSEGGAALPTMVAAEIFSNYKQPSPVRSVATIIQTLNGAQLSYPLSDGTAEVGELIAQNTFGTAADPVFGTAALTAYKFGSKTFAVPIELLDSAAADMTQFVSNRALERIYRSQNAYFTTGTGTAQPTGFVTAATVGKAALTGQTTSIIYEDIADLVDSTYGQYANLTWQLHPNTLRLVRRIKDTAGRPVFIPESDAKGVASPGTLLGFPINVNSDMPVAGANNKTLAFGDFSKYIIRDVLSFTLHRMQDSPYVKLGQVGFLAWMRSGGNLIDTYAVKTFQHSAT